VILISIAPRPSANPVIWVPSTPQAAVESHTSNLEMDKTVSLIGQISTNTVDKSAHLCHALYILLNVGTTAHPLSSIATRNLFFTIQNGTLLFLSSIWIDGSLGISVRLASLKHGEAFVKASLSSAPNAVQYDLQIVFPFLLAALCDQEQSIRQAATSCIKHLGFVRHEKGSTPPQIYALEDLPVHITGDSTFMDGDL
jgi:hypothetical protein